MLPLLEASGAVHFHHCMLTCTSSMLLNPHETRSMHPEGTQAEVDYGSPEQQEGDRGHVTIEAPTKNAGDLHDWEMLSRNSSPAPERWVSPPVLHGHGACSAALQQLMWSVS